MDITMAMTFGAVIISLIFWIITVKQAISDMDDNINNSMSQIGIQLSSKWDALIALLEITNGYVDDEMKIETSLVKLQISRESSPEEVIKQERMITEVMEKILNFAETIPLLKADGEYIKKMNAVNQYQNMINTSLLIHNESVLKLNRYIHRFPNFLCAGILGFSKRSYI